VYGHLDPGTEARDRLPCLCSRVPAWDEGRVADCDPLAGRAHLSPVLVLVQTSSSAGASEDEVVSLGPMPFGASRTRKQFTASQAKVGDKIDLRDGTHDVVSTSRIEAPSYPGAYRVEIRTDRGQVLDLDPSDMLSHTQAG